MDKIIQEFISQYKLEYDYFSNLAKKACDICDRDLSKYGIKAITSWRAKKPDSLSNKLAKRDKSKNYTSASDIRTDIADFAGVRIALYFPTEREEVDRLILNAFEVIAKKPFPDTDQNPNYQKRFSGYWANHYRVKIKKEDADQRFCDTIVEIQVASVLMHAWSEIEHDLVYKPNGGELSQEE